MTLFDLLEELQTKNVGVFSRLTDEQRKGLHPLIVMKWLACSKSEDQVLAVNELANTKMFDLYRHNDILFAVLGSCTTGKKERLKWMARPKRHPSQVLDILGEDALNMTEDEIVHELHRLGFDDKEIAKISPPKPAA